MLRNKEYLTIFLIMVTEVLGFSLILPFLPLFAQELGASAFEAGLLLTVFSVFQFFSAPILGKLSDHYGRKPLLIISQLSTFLSFIVLGFANSLWVIFLSRIIDGLFGSNFTIAQAYISDISSKEDRSKAFGLGGASFGIGFLIGPALGGFLSQQSFAYPAFAAAGAVFITILLTLKYLKETVPKKDYNFKFSEVKIFDVQSFTKFMKNKYTGSLMGVFFFYLLAQLLFVSVFAIYSEDHLGLNITQIGIVLTYVGIISIVLRGFTLQKLIDKFEETSIAFTGFILMSLGLILYAIQGNMLWILFATTIFSIGTGVIRPIIAAAISRSVPENVQGQVIGMTDSLGSFSQIAGPIAGGLILQHLNPAFLPITAAVSVILALAVFYSVYTNYSIKINGVEK